MANLIKEVFMSVHTNWQLVTPTEVRIASLDYNVHKADLTSKAFSQYAAAVIAHAISLAFFSYWYTSSLVANYAVGAVVATPIVQKPVQYVAEKVTDSTVKTAIYAYAAREGINPNYRPSLMDLASREIKCC